MQLRKTRSEVCQSERKRPRNVTHSLGHETQSKLSSEILDELLLYPLGEIFHHIFLLLRLSHHPPGHEETPYAPCPQSPSSLPNHREDVGLAQRYCLGSVPLLRPLAGSLRGLSRLLPLRLGQMEDDQLVLQGQKGEYFTLLSRSQK